MPVDARTIIEPWETEPLSLPPRSRLYHIEPVGIGTPYVESLTGFIVRLAEAHNNSTAVLFGHELAPLACKEYLRRAALRSKYPCRLLASAFHPLARAMNGTGVGASEWVEILQTLTLRTDLRFLTLLPWREVIPQGQLLRPTRAWCPACYQEWRDCEAVIYEPLLWTIRTVTVCPRHKESLQILCNHCKKTLHPLASRSRPGYCSICGIWLGDTAHIETLDARHEVDEIERQLWAANAVGELLAKAPSLTSFPTREGVLKSSIGYIKEYTGNLPALSKIIGTNKTTLWQWSKGKYLLQLESLLKLCYGLEVSLINFVTGKIITRSSVTVLASPQEGEKRIRATARQRIALDRRQAKKTLHAALKEVPPPSLQDVATRLGRDANTLRYRFGDLCKAVVARYAESEKASRAKRWKDIECALRRAMDEDEPQSVSQVASRLGYDIKTLTKRFPDLCRQISARYSGNRRTRWEEIQVALRSVLTEQPPPSVLKVAARLGLSKSSLYKHLPSLCHRIARRYVTSRRRSAGK